MVTTKFPLDPRVSLCSDLGWTSTRSGLIWRTCFGDTTSGMWWCFEKALLSLSFWIPSVLLKLRTWIRPLFSQLDQSCHIGEEQCCRGSRILHNAARLVKTLPLPPARPSRLRSWSCNLGGDHLVSFEEEDREAWTGVCRQYGVFDGSNFQTLVVTTQKDFWRVLLTLVLLTRFPLYSDGSSPIHHSAVMTWCGNVCQKFASATLDA